MSLFNRYEDKVYKVNKKLNNYLPLEGGKMKGNINLLYNRILNCPAAIDSTDPINNGVLDDALKKYTVLIPDCIL